MQQPVYFLSHGGGPWPWLDGPFRDGFAWLEASLKALPAQLPARPRAVLVVSGHWEEPGFTVSTAAQPGMVYDYYGFPEHTYHIRYPAPGAPDLAEEVVRLGAAAGIAIGRDPARGFDHGTFSMLQPIWPEADIPVLSLSLRADYDVPAHLALGRALAPLREEGVLLLGSGSITHNLHDFRAGYGSGREAPYVRPFIGWIERKLAAGDVDALLDYRRQAPFAQRAHPTDEHLLPLFFALGAAGDGARAQRIDAGIDLGFLAMDIYRFDGARPD